MFNNENNDYNFPKLNLKKGFDKFGNECFIFGKNQGNIKINDKKYFAKNINVFINEDIFIELESDFAEFENRNTLSFRSDDGWDINIICNKLNNNSEILFGYSSNFCCKKGNFNENDLFRSFYFIENLKLNNYDEKIKLNHNLKDLKLIVRNYDSLLNINGCFYFEEKGYFNKYDDAINNIKSLLKYYSTDLASMRLSCKCNSDDFIELRFNPISKYSNFKCQIPFCSICAENFANFINSTYDNYVNLIIQKPSINYIIDYLSYLHREQYGDVQIIISCMVLEMFNNLYSIEINPRIPAFIQELNNVLKQLDIDPKKLDGFFKQKDVLCNDGVISEIYAIRNRAFHGKRVSNLKISYLLSTFVTILFLKLLKVDCYIQLPICGSTWINTKNFVNKFATNEIKTDNNCSNYDNVIEINGKLYFPLNKLKNKRIYKNDEYILVEFNKESNILLFREVEKL